MTKVLKIHILDSKIPDFFNHTSALLTVKNIDSWLKTSNRRGKLIVCTEAQVKDVKKALDDNDYTE